jgi:peptide/nickel transport system substrate-binding protein
MDEHPEFGRRLDRAAAWLGLRNLSRRQLLRFLGGTTGVVALDAYITACTAQPAATTPPATAPAPAATSAPKPAPTPAAATTTTTSATAATTGSQPVTGGVLTIGYDAEPDSLNAFTTRLFASTESGIHEGLLVTDDKMMYQPVLVESVPTLDNGGVQLNPMRVTYRLLPNLKWSDGAPLTSDDIAFTWQAIVNPNFKRGGFGFSEGYDLIDKIDTPDPQTATLTFKANYAPYNAMFRALLPKHSLEGKDINTDPFNRKPIGAGSMRVKDWASGQFSQMERNPFYHVQGRPFLDGLVMKFLSDTNTRINQLRTGEVQYINQVPWDRMDEIAQFPNVQLQSVVANSWEHLDFNFKNPILQQLPVRQAIAMAIDKKSIADKVLQGRVPVADNFVSQLSWAYNPNVAKWDYNVDRARQTLEDAGWKVAQDGIREKDGQRLSFQCSTYSGDVLRERVQQVIQGQVREIGVELKTQNYPAATFFEQVNDGKYDIKIHRWIFPADPSYTTLYAADRMPPKGLNNMFWSNPEVTQVLGESDSEIDQSKRKGQLFRAQEIIAQELPIIPLFYRPNVIATTTRLKNVRMNPTNDGDMWAIRDWYLER